MFGVSTIYYYFLTTLMSNWLSNASLWLKTQKVSILQWATATPTPTTKNNFFILDNASKYVWDFLKISTNKHAPNLYNFAKSAKSQTTGLFKNSITYVEQVYSTQNLVTKFLNITHYCVFLLLVIILTLVTFLLIIWYFSTKNFQDKIVSVLDENILVTEDMDLLFIFFLITFLYMFGLLIWYSGVAPALLILGYQFVMLSVIVSALLIPFFLALVFGIHFLVGLKGSNSKNTWMLVAVEDGLNVLTFLIRFLLQTLRWCLILFSFAMLTEYYYTHTAPLTNNISVHSQGLLGMGKVLSIFRFGAELFDFTFIFTIQICTFFFILFWLLGYLFSTNPNSIFEEIFYRIKK